MEGEMIPAVYKCDVCNQVEKWHTWFEGWEGGCYEGKCESCYRASLGGTRTWDADLGRGPGTGADAESSAGQGGGDGDGQVGQAVEPLPAAAAASPTAEPPSLQQWNCGTGSWVYVM